MVEHAGRSLIREVQSEGEKKKLGCARGCGIATLATIGTLLIVCAGGSLLYLYVVHRAGSPEPVYLEIATPTVGEVRIAQLQWLRLKDALAQNREERIEFTASDLNALVAQQIEFAAARGRVRFTIADSAMTLELSGPMHLLSLPGPKQRWYDCALRFTLDYEYEQFSLGILEVRTSGWKAPDWLLTPAFDTWFNSMFTRRFQEATRNKPANVRVWKHIKQISVDQDKLVVTTQRL